MTIAEFQKLIDLHWEAQRETAWVRRQVRDGMAQPQALAEVEKAEAQSLGALILGAKAVLDAGNWPAVE